MIVITSVSVCDLKEYPFFIYSFLKVSEFSIIPLCTTEIEPEVCGWEFALLGTPCVAHRVWAIPKPPFGISPLNKSSKSWSTCSSNPCREEKKAKDILLAESKRALDQALVTSNNSNLATYQLRIQFQASFFELPNLLLQILLLRQHQLRRRK